MPKQHGLKRVMVIGSGPIVIGQAAEFDYAGTQACKALREEGIEVVLVNSNPATIMTDTRYRRQGVPRASDPRVCRQSDRRRAARRPACLRWAGRRGSIWLSHSPRGRVGPVRRPAAWARRSAAIQTAEDRQLFKDAMEAIGEPVPESTIVHSVEEAMAFAGASGTRSSSGPRTPWAAPAGALPLMRSGFEEIVARGPKSSPVVKFSSKERRRLERDRVRSDPGRRQTTASRYATWRTSTRSASIPAIRSSSRPARRSPTKSTRCCGPPP